MAIDNLAEFVSRLRVLLCLTSLDSPSVNPHDNLYDEWGLDSVQAFEMIVTIEGLAEPAVPPVELPSIFTVQDAFDYYNSCLDCPDGLGELT